MDVCFGSKKKLGIIFLPQKYNIISHQKN
jgi:hypothetical protein